MFGAGLPVLAVSFKCLNELVVDGERGYVFRDGAELGSLLEVMVGDWPEDGRLRRIRERVQRWAAVRWEQSWQEHAAPLFLTSVHHSASTPSYWSTLLSTCAAYVYSLLASISPHVGFLLTFSTVAVLFRISNSYSHTLPSLPSLPSLSSLSSLSLPLLLDSLTAFAHSPLASLIVLAVIAGVTFWLLVAYRVNRAVGEESGGVKGPRRGGGGLSRKGADGREVYTSSEEDKEE